MMSSLCHLIVVQKSKAAFLFCILRSEILANTLCTNVSDQGDDLFKIRQVNSLYILLISLFLTVHVVIHNLMHQIMTFLCSVTLDVM